jgi:hypothetical protein
VDGVHKWRPRDFALPSAMGDDCVEDLRTRLDLYLERYGLLVEHDGRPEGEFEFCSMLFVDGCWPQPLSWAKTLFRFVSKWDFSLLPQLAFDLRHSPQWSEVAQWLGRHQ